MALAVCCACWLTGCAHVQSTQSWPELVPRVAPGAPVAVTDASGVEVRGRVSAMSDSSITLKVKDGVRQFDAAEVRQVRRDGDSLLNGLGIGLAVGVSGAMLPDNRCTGDPPVCDDKQVPQRVVFAAVVAAGGMGIDLLNRDRTVLFGLPERVTLTVAPAWGPQSRGVLITIGF